METKYQALASGKTLFELSTTDPKTVTVTRTDTNVGVTVDVADIEAFVAGWPAMKAAPPAGR